MITGLAWLVGFQLAGDLLARVFDLPVPGTVVGMLLCFGWLRWRRTPDDAPVVRAATAVLGHLQLFFIPAGVGVVVYLTLLRDHAFPVALALAGSWFLGLAVVGWSATLLDQVAARRAERTS